MFFPPALHVGKTHCPALSCGPSGEHNLSLALVAEPAELGGFQDTAELKFPEDSPSFKVPQKAYRKIN